MIEYKTYNYSKTIRERNNSNQVNFWRKTMDLDNPKYYLSKHLSWLKFNQRVLEEACDSQNPLLERLKYLSITASNLDEFFMIRVARLKNKISSEYIKQSTDLYSAEDEFIKISKESHNLISEKYKCWHQLKDQLAKENIYIKNYQEINHLEKSFLDNYFNTIIYPVLTPITIDPVRPFPHISNKSLNLIISLKYNTKDNLFKKDNLSFNKNLKRSKDKSFQIALVQIPSNMPRFLDIPTSKKKTFILIEEIIKNKVRSLFQGFQIESIDMFRITRNADVNLQENADDFLGEMEDYLERREWGSPVRLEIEKGSSNKIKAILSDYLQLQNEDIYNIDGPLDLSALIEIRNIRGYDNLKFQKLYPLAARDFYFERNIFNKISRQDALIHHPYESFEPVLEFLEKAANDPQVLAIKQTLYRLSDKSPIINSLVKAARNGKQVTVIIELKARFDEEENIKWAKKLEEAGCHVVYGLVGLKVHAKLLLVIRSEKGRIKKYLHMSTGNYNDQTAELYTDISLFTARESYTNDIANLFNVLTSFSAPPSWQKIIISPLNLREKFIELIDNEINECHKGKEGHIIAKINSLVDKEIIKKLYQASIAGVKIDLIVRGISCIRPGLEDISENIRVISIVGKLLEHSRIFFFANGGDSKVFMASADWRPRNLDRRVETLVPIEDKEIKNRIIEILNICLKDTVKARIQLPDGSCTRINKYQINKIESQVELYKMALAEIKAIEKEREERKKNLFLVK
ncbi:polyphosphate kinase 1 [Natronospora cellulosivora (SeqCode)]